MELSGAHLISLVNHGKNEDLPWTHQALLNDGYKWVGISTADIAPVIIERDAESVGESTEEDAQPVEESTDEDELAA